MNDLKLIPKKFLLGGVINPFDSFMISFVPAPIQVDTAYNFKTTKLNSKSNKLLDTLKLMLYFNSKSQYPHSLLYDGQELDYEVSDLQSILNDTPIQQAQNDTLVQQNLSNWKIPSKLIDIANNPNGYKVTPAQRDLIVLHMIEVGRSRINKSGNPKALHYKWGSKNPNSGAIDCSGFTQYLYNSVGFHIGNGSANQWNSGVNMGTDYHIAQPGDLIINRSTGRKRHVRMVTKNENGKITVLESAGRVGVREAPLDVHNLVGQVRVVRPLVCS